MHLQPRRRPLACLAMITMLAAGCGQASSQDVVSQAGQNLGKVRSGNLDLRMMVTGRDSGQTGQIGFEERGPFSLPAAGSLPVARTEVIHFVGTQQDSSTFTSTGSDAFITAGGQTYALSPARIQALRQASTPVGNNLAGLQVDRWASGGSVGDGGQVDGVSTDHVVAAVNVRQFLNDLMQLSRGLGQAASVPQISQSEAQDLARVVKASHFELWAGRDDHLVRRLTVAVDFAAPAGAAGGGLAKYSQSHLELDLVLGAVNQPVTVSRPGNVQPFSVFCTHQPTAGACSSPQS